MFPPGCTNCDVPLPLRYDVTIRQQPMHARISAMKISDRRPVDPPIIVQLNVKDLRDPGYTGPHLNLERHSHLTNPYYFMYATLVEANSNNEVRFVSKDDGRPSTAGALVSSIRVLKDDSNPDEYSAFFIFPDICVRLEGSWRFQLSLFVVDGPRVRSCATVYSAPFFVYPGKQFPGVQISTPLARALAAQGVRLRIRNEIREKTAQKDGRGSESSSDTRQRSPSPPKRRRTLPNAMAMGSLHAAAEDIEAPSSSMSSSPTDMADVFPCQMLPPGTFHRMTKRQTHDARVRRASFDEQAFTRANSSNTYAYHQNQWVTPRALDMAQSVPPPSPSPTFTFTMPFPSKPDPDELLQLGLMRPAHPSPEATHGAGAAYLFPRQNQIRIPVEDGDRYPTDASEHTGYSWSASSITRDIFPPSVASLSYSTTSEPIFWHMDSYVGSPRGDVEQGSETQPQPGWSGRTMYGEPNQ
ncbi:velvet factor-domain-containing protein [Mycena crocata]|nr:velvet factor-domain-containing protein [Mycena crocata]